MSRSFFNLLTGAVVASLLMTACAEQKPKNTNIGQSGQVTATGEAQIGGDYVLTDHNGRKVSNKDFSGKPQLIYFGYAYCPDICPLALQKMAAGMKMANMDAADITPIFITVDPERDTPEKLNQYVKSASFPPGLVGLGGDKAQIEQAKKAFKVFSAKAGPGEDYLVDHSNFIYFMDKNGRFIDLFGSDTTPDIIAKRLKEYKKTGR